MTKEEKDVASSLKYVAKCLKERILVFKEIKKNTKLKVILIKNIVANEILV